MVMAVAVDDSKIQSSLKIGKETVEDDCDSEEFKNQSEIRKVQNHATSRGVAR